MSGSRRLTGLALGLSLFAVSCASAPHGSAADLAGKLDGYARDVLPEYESYLEADKRLDPSSRAIRLKHASEMRRLLNEALGRS